MEQGLTIPAVWTVNMLAEWCLGGSCLGALEERGSDLRCGVLCVEKSG